MALMGLLHQQRQMRPVEQTLQKKNMCLQAILLIQEDEQKGL